jgi:hypothetical protein
MTLNSALSNPLVTPFIGFVLGLLSEDVKRVIQRRHQSREARRRVYDDLGAYLGRVEALSLLNRLDLLLWNEVISRSAPNFDYYTAHEPGVLLRRVSLFDTSENLFPEWRATSAPPNSAPPPPSLARKIFDRILFPTSLISLRATAPR